MDNNSSDLQMHSSELESENHPAIPIDPYPLPEGYINYIFSMESALGIYNKLMQFPILFDDDVRGKFDIFCADLLAPNSIILLTKDYGITRIEHICPERGADIHLAFWDRRFKGRDEECKQTLKWLFDKCKLLRSTVRVPEIAYSTIRFTEALGFKREGIIRDAWKYNGKLLDLHVFGLLKDEILK